MARGPVLGAVRRRGHGHERQDLDRAAARAAHARRAGGDGTLGAAVHGDERPTASRRRRSPACTAFAEFRDRGVTHVAMSELARAEEDAPRASSSTSSVSPTSPATTSTTTDDRALRGAEGEVFDLRGGRVPVVGPRRRQAQWPLAVGNLDDPSSASGSGAIAPPARGSASLGGGRGRPRRRGPALERAATHFDLVSSRGAVPMSTPCSAASTSTTSSWRSRRCAVGGAVRGDRRPRRLAPAGPRPDGAAAPRRVAPTVVVDAGHTPVRCARPSRRWAYDFDRVVTVFGWGSRPRQAAGDGADRGGGPTSSS